MNKPPSSFPTNDCYIYERYKTFLLNNVSFMALVSFQVNFIRAAHRDSKNEIEKQYLQQHSLTEKRSIATFYNREHGLLVIKQHLQISYYPLQKFTSACYRII